MRFLKMVFSELNIREKIDELRENKSRMIKYIDFYKKKMIQL